MATKVVNLLSTQQLAERIGTTPHLARKAIIQLRISGKKINVEALRGGVAYWDESIVELVRAAIAKPRDFKSQIETKGPQHDRR